MLRLERRQTAAIIQSIENNNNIQNATHDSSLPTLNGNAVIGDGDATPVVANRRQLILNTIEDLKRNLEDQSIELCGLNEDDD